MRLKIGVNGERDPLKTLSQEDVLRWVGYGLGQNGEARNAKPASNGRVSSGATLPAATLPLLACRRNTGSEPITMALENLALRAVQLGVS